MENDDYVLIRHDGEVSALCGWFRAEGFGLTTDIGAAHHYHRKDAERLIASHHPDWAGSACIQPLPDKQAPFAVFDLRAHLSRAIAFSRTTFGPGARTAGIIAHIRKELAEIEATPDDLEEWIDVAILAFDGAWRAGYTPDQIVAALAAKQAKNEGRTWPDWRTASPDAPIEHVKAEGEA